MRRHRSRGPGPEGSGPADGRVRRPYSVRISCPGRTEPARLARHPASSPGRSGDAFQPCPISQGGAGRSPIGGCAGPGRRALAGGQAVASAGKLTIRRSGAEASGPGSNSLCRPLGRGRIHRRSGPRSGSGANMRGPAPDFVAGSTAPCERTGSKHPAPPPPQNGTRRKADQACPAKKPASATGLLAERRVCPAVASGARPAFSEGLHVPAERKPSL